MYYTLTLVSMGVLLIMYESLNTKDKVESVVEEFDKRDVPGDFFTEEGDGFHEWNSYDIYEVKDWLTKTLTTLINETIEECAEAVPGDLTSENHNSFCITCRKHEREREIDGHNTCAKTARENILAKRIK